MARSSGAFSVDLAGWCREDPAPRRHITADLIREKLMAKSTTACIMSLRVTYEIILADFNNLIEIAEPAWAITGILVQHRYNTDTTLDTNQMIYRNVYHVMGIDGSFDTDHQAAKFNSPLSFPAIRYYMSHLISPLLLLL